MNDVELHCLVPMILFRPSVFNTDGRKVEKIVIDDYFKLKKTILYNSMRLTFLYKIGLILTPIYAGFGSNRPKTS